MSVALVAENVGFVFFVCFALVQGTYLKFKLQNSLVFNVKYTSTLKGASNGFQKFL